MVALTASETSVYLGAVILMQNFEPIGYFCETFPGLGSIVSNNDSVILQRFTKRIRKKVRNRW